MGGRLTFLVLAVALTAAVAAQQQAEKNNMELVGSSDLQSRSAYQPVIHKQGDRWVLYVGHHGGMALNPLTGKEESNGTSILDGCPLAPDPGQAMPVPAVRKSAAPGMISSRTRSGRPTRLDHTSESHGCPNLGRSARGARRIKRVERHVPDAPCHL